MKNKRRFVPGFINKLDEYLLLNKPATWSARTHLVLYYGLVFSIALTAVCFLIPDDPRSRSNVYIWGFLVAVLAVIGFITWLIYLLRFNVFKRFGIVTMGDKIKTFLLYFIAIGTMVVVIYIPAVIESVKANRAYGNEEIVQDVNTINLSICRLNYDSIPHKWKADTFLVRNMPETTVYDEDGQVLIHGHGKDFHLIDTANFKNRKMDADSVIAINDSLFVLFKCPDYNFVNADGGGMYADARILNSADIYYTIFKKPAIADKNKAQTLLTQLLKKYNAVKSPYRYDVVEADDQNDGYLLHIRAKYALGPVNSSLYNITERKYRWQGNSMEIFLRLFYYSTLIVTLLVFIFRHSAIKTFFLTLLSAVILLILTLLFLTLVRTGTTGVFLCCIVYFLFFLVLALTVNYARTRNVINGIGLNLTVFFTAFMPLLIISFYYQLLRNADNLKEYDARDFNKYNNENLHYFYAEIIGAALLFVLIETLFKQLYRKWYALPEA
ncbi:MAG TPA: hypothetical protein VK645_17455 [Chitinophagaceae bacterium]|nr:hypothetical protein [Chitinophagaceae bacterium]